MGTENSKMSQCHLKFLLKVAHCILTYLFTSSSFFSSSPPAKLLIKNARRHSTKYKLPARCSLATTAGKQHTGGNTPGERARIVLVTPVGNGLGPAQGQRVPAGKLFLDTVPSVLEINRLFTSQACVLSTLPESAGASGGPVAARPVVLMSP